MFIFGLISAGSGQEAGLLPRALASMFRKLQGRLYGAMDLKPVMYQDVKQLGPTEVKVEESRRNSLLKEVNPQGLVIKLLLLLSNLDQFLQFLLTVFIRITARRHVDLGQPQSGIAVLQDSHPRVT